ncbi:MAG: carbohydrate kinase family protein [Thermodesulfovibrionales bacterium]
MDNRSVILGLGALNMDYLFRVEEFLRDGETFIKEFYKSPGGSAANTIAILSQLGIPSSFFGVTGKDQDGDLIEESLRAKGVKLYIQRLEGATGRAFIFVDRLGRRSIYVLPGVNICLKDIDYPGLYDFQWVHVTSLVGEEAFHRQAGWLLKLPEDIRLSFSPGMIYARYGLRTIEPLLKRTYILFLNKDELGLLFPSEDIKEAIKKLHGLGPEFISVTLGGEGALLSFKGRFHYQESLAKEVIDTTGAGDAFSAGVLYGLIKGFDISQCGFIGSYLAGKVLRTWGSHIEVTEEEIRV